MKQWTNRRQLGRSIAPFVGFLLVFVVVLLGVSHWYLVPALRRFSTADSNQKRVLGAYAGLLLTALLVFLGLFGVLIFRPWRYFLPNPPRSKSKTKYIDAWGESGKRMKPPGEDE